MMSITDPRRSLSRDLLDAPGGFLWWYMDLVDSEGNGCVLIWSFGLPFLPGRESRARSGDPQLPRARPSLNVAIYRRSRPALYLLQEIDPSSASWDPETGSVRLGDSTMQTSLSEGERDLQMRIDCRLPQRQRLTGSVSLRGPACRLDRDLGQDPQHQWSPLCTAAVGEASFQLDGDPFLSVRGRGYHDRNGSTAPLDALGIKHWIWGRSPCGDRERIWYVLWPHRGEVQAWGFEVHPEGRIEPVDGLAVRCVGRRIGVFGMPWHRRVELTSEGRPWLSVNHAHTVDLGFFYGRWIAHTLGPHGERGVGIAEAVRPGRVDRSWNRWLVGMAVHRAHAPNSPFLPLFAGVCGRARHMEGAA